MIYLLLKYNLLNIDLNEDKKKIIQNSLKLSLANMVYVYKFPIYILLCIYIFFNLIFFFMNRKTVFTFFYNLPLFNSALRLLRSYVLLIKYEI